MNKRQFIYKLYGKYEDDYPEELRFCEDNNATLTLLKLITGEIIVKKEGHKNSTIPRDFSMLQYKVLSDSNKIDKTPFINVFADGVDEEIVGKIKEYLDKDRTNTSIVKSILIELSNCLVKYDNCLYSTAFIHIYRMTEYMTFIFPHIYVKCLNSYKGSYNALKSFFKSEDELRMFRILRDKIYDKNLILDYEFTFDFSDLEEDDFLEIKNIFSKNYFEIQFNYGNDNIKLSFRDMFDFILSLRNKCFHMLEGTEISYIKIDNSDFDIIFKSITLQIVNWFCVFFIGLTKCAYYGRIC